MGGPAVEGLPCGRRPGYPERMADPTIRGGCLCGALRYVARGAPSASMLCHCRSCAHAAGAPAVAWITVEADGFAWERGTPAVFHSTPPVTRTFCASCGT